MISIILLSRNAALSATLALERQVLAVDQYRLRTKLMLMAAQYEYGDSS
jgi:hypothetical protein